MNMKLHRDSKRTAMNPAIRALAQDTDAWCEQNHIDSSGWGGAAWEAEFADRIVLACAEICLEANDHKNILTHFGVEA
jgi:hypothetical protein